MNTTDASAGLLRATAATPGPWEAKGMFVMHGTRYICVVDSQETSHRDRRPNSPPIGEAYANANLIAAAPDLLAALERIRDARDSMAEHGKYPFPGPASDQGFDDWAADVADAAIAKAKGAA